MAPGTRTLEAIVTLVRRRSKSVDPCDTTEYTAVSQGAIINPFLTFCSSSIWYDVCSSMSLRRGYLLRTLCFTLFYLRESCAACASELTGLDFQGTATSTFSAQQSGHQLVECCKCKWLIGISSRRLASGHALIKSWSLTTCTPFSFVRFLLFSPRLQRILYSRWRCDSVAGLHILSAI